MGELNYPRTFCHNPATNITFSAGQPAPASDALLQHSVHGFHIQILPDCRRQKIVLTLPEGFPAQRRPLGQPQPFLLCRRLCQSPCKIADIEDAMDVGATDRSCSAAILLLPADFSALRAKACKRFRAASFPNDAAAHMDFVAFDLPAFQGVKASRRTEDLAANLCPRLFRPKYSIDRKKTNPPHKLRQTTLPSLNSVRVPERLPCAAVFLIRTSSPLSRSHSRSAIVLLLPGRITMSGCPNFRMEST